VLSYGSWDHGYAGMGVNTFALGARVWVSFMGMTFFLRVRCEGLMDREGRRRS